VAFDRAVAPRFGDGAFHRTEIVSDGPHEALERVDVRGVRGGEPAVQGRDLADAQNGAEAQDQTPHGGKPRNLRLQDVDGLGLSRARSDQILQVDVSILGVNL
jgi:hypothetical protein